LAEAWSSGQTAFAIGEALADSPLMVAASFYLGVTCAKLGDFREAKVFFQTGLRALGDDRGRERCGLMGSAAVMVRSRFAETLAERGEFGEGLAHGQEALQIAEKLDHPYSLAMACHSLGFLYGVKGDLEQAVRLLERGVELAERWNLTVWLPTLSVPLGRVYALMGRCSEAISILRRTRDRYSSMYGRGSPDCMINLGEALARVGQFDEGASLAHQALTIAREHGLRVLQGLGFRLAAEIAAHRDPPGVIEPEDYYRQALGLAEQLDMRPLVAHCHLGLGKVYGHTGKRQEAQERLATARTMYREMDMRFWVEQVEAEEKR